MRFRDMSRAELEDALAVVASSDLPHRAELIRALQNLVATARLDELEALWAKEEKC